MKEKNQRKCITTRVGQVAWIKFPFDQKPWKRRPALILGMEADYLRVVSGTSQIWHEGDDGGFVKVDDGCGLSKPTYFQVTEVYRVPTSKVRKIAGEMPDNLFRIIRERTDGLSAI